jgi:hypothetical protein
MAPQQYPQEGEWRGSGPTSWPRDLNPQRSAFPVITLTVLGLVALGIYFAPDFVRYMKIRQM